MNNSLRFTYTNAGVTVKVSIFSYGDITLAKAEQKIEGVDTSWDASYGWAYRNSEDKPNFRKGAMVALDKALDRLLLTSKARHEIHQLVTKPKKQEHNCETCDVRDEYPIILALLLELL